MKTIKIKFKWRDKNGIFHYVHNMKTKHLFYTWLMIWNHCCPKNIQIWFNHKYIFPSFYTKKYLLKAFKFLYQELKNRADLGFKSKQVIEKIESLYLKDIKKIIYDEKH